MRRLSTRAKVIKIKIILPSYLFKLVLELLFLVVPSSLLSILATDDIHVTILLLIMVPLKEILPTLVVAFKHAELLLMEIEQASPESPRLVLVRMHAGLLLVLEPLVVLAFTRHAMEHKHASTITSCPSVLPLRAVNCARGT